MKSRALSVNFILIWLVSLTTLGNEKKPNVLFIAIDDLNDWTGYLKGNLQAKTLIWISWRLKALFLVRPLRSTGLRTFKSCSYEWILPSTSGNYINKVQLLKTQF